MTKARPGGSNGGPDRVAAVYAALSPLFVLGQAALSAAHEKVLFLATTDRAFADLLAGAIAGSNLCLLLFAAVVLLRQRGRHHRSAGRLRFTVGALGGVLNGLAALVCVAILLTTNKAALLEAGLGVSIPPQYAGVFQAAVSAMIVGDVLVLGASFAAGVLLDKKIRQRIFLAVDAMLLFLVAWAITQLPARPEGNDSAQLALAGVRHSTVGAGLVRLLWRLTPFVLDLVETAGFRALVAARHLRSKKSGFLTAISVLAILAVTVSSCALTTTLSVMGGFRNDLKRKILGNTAHVVVDREHKSLEGWDPLLQRARSTDGVSGASPYVSGEVMLSSASNLATAVLRGIDPGSVASVSDLPNNMRSGTLDYLSSPEKLLDLPPSIIRGGPIDLSDSILRPSEGLGGADGGVAKAGPPAGGAAAGPDAGTGSATDLDAERAEIEARLTRLEAFLREPPGGEEPKVKRDVLPGIVIGQELARSLRLYLGDEVNVVAPLGALGPSGPMPKARPFRVAGIFYSGMYEYDMKSTYVSLETAQQFLGTGQAISGIEVKVDEVERAPQVATLLRQKLDRAELRVRDWQELNSRLFGALALEKLAMFVALGIAILVASFCIAGTLTLMVQEKGREVAILKAMGSSDRAIIGVFVIEGGLIGLLGAALGLSLGYMMCFAAEHMGVRMNPEVYYIDRLPVHVDPTEFVLTGIAAVVVCLLVTVYPALLASRLRPVDALRHE